MKECIYCKRVVDCIKENRLCFKTVLGEYWAYKGVDYMITLREDKQCPFEQLYYNMGWILEGVPDGFDSVQEVIDWIVENTSLKGALEEEKRKASKTRSARRRQPKEVKQRSRKE